MDEVGAHRAFGELWPHPATASAEVVGGLGTMRFALTSQQYVKINAVVQRLPHAQRHFFLVALAGKLSLNAPMIRNVPDALLAKLIDAMRNVQWVRRKQWHPLPELRQSGHDADALHVSGFWGKARAVPRSRRLAEASHLHRPRHR
jgi:hypothetical protein